MTSEQLRALLDRAYGLGAQSAYRWMQRKPGTGPQLQDINQMDKEREKALGPIIKEAAAGAIPMIGLPVLDPSLLEVGK